MEYKEACNKLLERNRELEGKEVSRKSTHQLMAGFIHDVLVSLI